MRQLPASQTLRASARQADSQWRSRAACRSVDAEIFFPAATEGPIYEAQVAVAKAVCAGCSVRAECLAEALIRIPYGIAGGLTPEERRGRHASDQAHRTSDEKHRAERVLERGLRLGASRPEVAAAGRLLLTAGRPVAEVAARCGVTERTAARWAASTGPPADDDSTTSTAARGGTGKDRGGSRALPQISHPNAQPRTPAAEGARA